MDGWTRAQSRSKHDLACASASRGQPQRMARRGSGLHARSSMLCTIIVVTLLVLVLPIRLFVLTRARDSRSSPRQERTPALLNAFVGGSANDTARSPPLQAHTHVSVGVEKTLDSLLFESRMFSEFLGHSWRQFLRPHGHRHQAHLCEAGLGARPPPSVQPVRASRS